ncbi:type II restriction endonuclease [Pseudoflavitalea rhizosphaerae]|uniref:type II restriction endonuclease n=1 Tax=Pseudoflavitalea rhizosphaerae TaxID=1884793 RepID=UPI000F8C3E3A|nr:type II restriction endonuclease [Pseudoflavitalea rhizosphaerae]
MNKKGYLSQYFVAVAAKRLSTVEVNIKKSNQHEFNGSEALKKVLGTNEYGDTVTFKSRFVWIEDDNATTTADAQLSWYNARFGKERAAEWRLYFPTTDVSQRAQAGDLLIIARRPDDTLLCIITPAQTTVESQLLWLFEVPVQSGKSFVYQDFQQSGDKEISFPVRFILEELGIEIEDTETDYLDSILSRFKGKMPTTKEFSILTRQTLKDIYPLDDPDAAIMSWMSHEEKLFRRMERFELEKRLRQGFFDKKGNADVEGFLKFSLSIQNTRKSRAGLALENHTEEIFRLHQIKFDRAKVTENKAKPDFLFPGAREYHLASFKNENLTMLGVKTTCKDRWRQVLSEANRIKNKHLLTLEPGISENQTNEMMAHGLQLILPASIHTTFSTAQRSWLMNLKEFISHLRSRQVNLKDFSGELFS